MQYNENTMIGRSLNVRVDGKVKKVFCIGRHKGSLFLGLALRRKCCGVDRRFKFKLGRNYKYVAVLNADVCFDVSSIAAGDTDFIGRDKAHIARRLRNDLKRSKY